MVCFCKISLKYGFFGWERTILQQFYLMCRVLSNGFGRGFEAVKKTFYEAGGSGLDHLGEEFVWWVELSRKGEGGLACWGALEGEIALNGYGRTAHLCFASPL